MSLSRIIKGLTIGFTLAQESKTLDLRNTAQHSKEMNITTNNNTFRAAYSIISNDSTEQYNSCFTTEAFNHMLKDVKQTEIENATHSCTTYVLFKPKNSSTVSVHTEVMSLSSDQCGPLQNFTSSFLYDCMKNIDLKNQKNSKLVLLYFLLIPVAACVAGVVGMCIKGELNTQENMRLAGRFR